MSSSVPTSSQWASLELRHATARVLARMRVLPCDIDDLTQEALARALASGQLPTSLAECEAYVKKVAHDLAVDDTRRNSARRAWDVGLCDSPDDWCVENHGHMPAIDQLLARECIDRVREAIAQGELPARMLSIWLAVSEGVPQEEIADEHGIAHQTVRNDLHRLRQLLA
jgi:RNA polymerase sigma factor (sigma-70 family)